MQLCGRGGKSGVECERETKRKRGIALCVSVLPEGTGLMSLKELRIGVIGSRLVEIDCVN